MHMNTIEQSPKYQEIGEMLIREREDLSHLEGVRIAYLASDQEKKSSGRTIFGECRKVSPIYAWCCPYDFMITIFEPNLARCHFDCVQEQLLVWHELLHIGVDETDDGPKYRIIPHDIEEFDAILSKAGTHWQAKNVKGAGQLG